MTSEKKADKKKADKQTRLRAPRAADVILAILFAGYIAFVLNSLAVRQVIAEMNRLLNKFVY